jgi:hypothetical protein
MKAFRRVVAFAFLCILPAFAGNTYTADQAKSHVGELATACGMVVRTHFSAALSGKPTFLNLDKPYPNHVFTVLIWGSDRAKFGSPEWEYFRKNICVTGSIENSEGTAEIVARSPSQIARRAAPSRSQLR